MNTYVVIFKKRYRSGREGWITTVSEPADNYDAALEEVWSRPSIGNKELILETKICHIDDFMAMKTPNV